MNLELIGISTPVKEPIEEVPGLLPAFKSVDLLNLQLKVTFDGSVEVNDILVIRITPLSAGQSTNINGLRQVGTVAGGASEAVITEKYTAQFGTPSQGDKIQVQVYALNTWSGHASNRQIFVTSISGLSGEVVGN